MGYIDSEMGIAPEDIIAEGADDSTRELFIVLHDKVATLADNENAFRKRLELLIHGYEYLAYMSNIWKYLLDTNDLSDDDREYWETKIRSYVFDMNVLMALITGLIQDHDEYTEEDLRTMLQNEIDILDWEVHNNDTE